ncbi:MAG: tetratricopeptide repeat protein [Saprospiraceae bacterium]|nr:tetratricopeptide repeat protein [Saprospiraceae bacterium]
MKELNKLLLEVKKLNKNKEYSKVIDLLTNETLENYNNSNLYAEKAMAFWNSKKYNECKKSAEIALELDKNNAKAYYYLGNIAQEFKEYRKAEEYYFKAIEIDPKNSAPYNGLGSVYDDLEEYGKAEEYYLKAIEIDPELPYSYNGLGNVYLYLKDFGKAKEYYIKAIEIDPEIIYPYNGLGNVYSDLKEYEKAKEYYIKAIEIDPKYIYPYNGLGIVYSDLKEHEKAKEWFLKAIEIDPKFTYPYNGLGNVYFGFKEYEKAKKYYLKAININSNIGDYYYNLGLVYENLNEYEKAKQNFNKFLTIELNSEDVFYKRAVSKISEIDKILENSTYKKVNDIVAKIKNLLKYKGEFVTHYTGISTVQFLVLKESPMRLSEGSFLNDTSEGQELFSFLNYLAEQNVNKKCNKESFTRRPFIGSFVDADKNNDLTLWRMYGKELLEEAKGCSITLNSKDLVSKIKNHICPDKDFTPSSFDDIEFYRVVYRDGYKFEFAGATKKQNKDLSDLMQLLFKIIEEFKQKIDLQKKEEIEVVELLNQIAYLFKSTEYKYENEIRLIIKDAIGFERKIDFDINNFKPSATPLKVYIELVPIHSLLNKITIGPKVDKAEEWASTFYYYLSNKDLYPEIEISTLPFK